MFLWHLISYYKIQTSDSLMSSEQPCLYMQVTQKQLAKKAADNATTLLLFVISQRSLNPYLNAELLLPLSADWYLLLATPIPVHSLRGHSKMLPSELLCQAGNKEKQVSTFYRHLQQWIRLNGRDSSTSSEKLNEAYGNWRTCYHLKPAIKNTLKMSN